MLVRAKHWVKVNGVWIQPNTEFEADEAFVTQMTADVDVLRMDEQISTENSETAVEEAPAADPVKQPAKRSGRPRKKNT